jgi:hypothetical protein
VEPISGVVTAAHGWQLMTVQSDVSSHLAMLCMLGSGIKRGYTRPVDRLGYIHLKDVVPTLCHLLKIDPPTQSQGTVAYDLFEGFDMTRSRSTFEEEEVEIDKRLWIQDDMFDFTLLQQAHVSVGSG